MMMTINPATSNDVATIAGFVNELADYEKLSDEVDFEEKQFRDYLFDARHEPAPEVLIAREHGKPVGFALSIHILPAVIHLEDLFVSPHARGKGIGISLLAGLAHKALSENVSKIEWACLDWNTTSLNFYYSIGAVAIPDRVLYRITGKALQNRTYASDSHTVSEAQPGPDGKRLDIKDEDGNIGGSVWYTLSFTTFLATPVVLVTRCEAPSPIAIQLIDILVHMANTRGYKRVDIRINPSTQSEFADELCQEFQAFQLTGWIPLALCGDALGRLANRAVM
jgi:GNAT superfamily N-acetyltransferase